MRHLLMILLCLGAAAHAAAGDAAPAPAPAPAHPAPPAATADAADPAAVRAQASYQVGLQMGLEVKMFSLDMTAFVKGVQDTVAGTAKPVDAQRMQTLMDKYLQQLNDAAQKANAAWFAANLKKPGMQQLPDGVQYEVLAKGTGRTPTPGDQVKVNYKGTLPDGTVFDSSEMHGGPQTFPVGGGIIKGWADTLEAMKEGDKWRIYVPPALAYGARGAPPQIPPNQILIFDIELVKVEPSTTGAPPAP